MFNIGDKVAYPMHGAGIVESIEERQILGETKSYYIVRTLHGNMQIMVPVKGCEQVGLRYIVRPDAIDGIIDVLGSESTPMDDNWNRRNRENMEHLRTGDIKEVAGVVRNLLRVEREKPLSTGEKKMLTNARQILTSELVLVLGLAEAAVQEMIETAV